jgi:hypothetical protein
VLRLNLIHAMLLIRLSLCLLKNFRAQKLRRWCGYILVDGELICQWPPEAVNTREQGNGLRHWLSHCTICRSHKAYIGISALVKSLEWSE